MIENQKIDYDKSPIEIKDYNTLFVFLITISMIPIVIYAYIHNLNTPGGMSESSLYRNVFIIIPFLMKPYIIPYLKSRNKRKIILMNDSIKFMHENNIIEEIKISELTDIKRTYSDLYHKTQVIGELSYIAFIFVFIILLIADMLYILLFLYPILHICLIIIKYFFHKIKDKNYKFKLFDAIIIYSKDRFINILPITNKEYEEVRKYFFDKDFGNIKDKKIFIEIGHLYEKIDLDKH
ncbi:hypothetical protein [Aliarcobacter butzleri]|uniref:hypothetical protein n=1 Tax=Aliarcobacter butzleri TaxID=28197 RepID=UPI00062E7026|nr:hypothetical protein [Aliarcobacter butzleri]KLD96849.1 hypothetical protein AF74_09145 [Aliarcobacter butzleri L349]MCG3671886.1 hypothetical protein [Aliarcobacter butzleri]MDN5058675.1 hypothetical protein [Aliarcobacter butzleri]